MGGRSPGVCRTGCLGRRVEGGTAEGGQQRWYRSLDTRPDGSVGVRWELCHDGANGRAMMDRAMMGRVRGALLGGGRSEAQPRHQAPEITTRPAVGDVGGGGNRPAPRGHSPVIRQLQGMPSRGLQDFMSVRG